MTSEPGLIVQLAPGGAADRSLRTDPPPSIASGQVVLDHVPRAADGRLPPPEAGEIVLSVLSPDALRRAVASGDLAALTLVPGVGKKVAGRIALDLKDRIGMGGESAASGPLAEVREALLALGLSQVEAREALTALVPDGDRPVEELLREALRSVGR